MKKLIIFLRQKLIKTWKYNMMDVTMVTKEHILTTIDAQILGRGIWVHKLVIGVMGIHGCGAM
jgi:hypothetical protein